MPSDIIELNSFSYEIDGKPILKNLCCSIKKGEHLSIIGPNGAGKTTLIKCIANILHDRTGKISLKGQPLNSYSPKQLAQLISYVPQAENGNFPFTVSEFVLLSRYPHLSPFSSPDKEDFEAVHQALKQTETLEFEHRKMNTLSGGQKQRVLIAAALAQQTDIVLLDEPTTFLDPKHQSDVLCLLKEMHEKQDKTIITVTHDINHAATLSDRILALKEGSIAFLGPIEKCMTNETLQPIYDKEFLFINHPVSNLPIVIPEILK